MQRAAAHMKDARRAVVRRWAVVTLGVAALALLLAPLCTDGVPMGGMFTAESPAGAVAGAPPAMPMPTPLTECAAPTPEPEPVSACAGAASHAAATNLSLPDADQVVLACIAVLVAVLVAVLGLRALRGSFGTAVTSASRVRLPRLGLPAPRPTPARLCVLRT